MVIQQQSLMRVALCAALLAAGPAGAQTSTPTSQTPAVQTQPANEQVVVPQVDRRQLKLPKFPSKDFEVGLFGGVYSTDNFGASGVAGLRLAYHITEDFFVQANYGVTRVSDENFRQILPGGIFATPTETLRYYNLTAGYNVLPGEIFLGRNSAKAAAVYLLGGVGSTHLRTNANDLRMQTINFGVGMRVLLAERFSVHMDMRDHVYSLDLLGRRQSTHNLEYTAGLSWYF